MSIRLRPAVILAALLLPASASAVHLCFGPPAGGTEPVIVHCTPPGPEYEPGWQGFGTTWAEACLLGTDCLPWEGPTVWYLSRSDEAPHFVTGTLPAGPASLYLWLICSGAGVSEAEFSLAGDILVTGYTPLNGTSAGGTLPDVHVTAAGDCPAGPVLFGRVDVFVGSSTAVADPGHEAWGRVKARYR